MPSFDEIYNNISYSTTISNKDKAKILGNMGPAAASKEAAIGSANTYAAGGIAQAAISSQAAIFGHARQGLALENVANTQQAGMTQRTGMMESGLNKRNDVIQGGLNRRFGDELMFEQQKFAEDKYRARKGFGKYTETSTGPPVNRFRTLENQDGNPIGALDTTTGQPMYYNQSQNNQSAMGSQIKNWLNQDRELNQ